MPLSALDNPLVLPLLGLLVEQPAHAYALVQRFHERYPGFETRRSSVTTLVKSLAASGLIAAQPSRRVAKRPARTVFELTGSGYEYVRARVNDDVAAARAGSRRFTLAVAYLGVLPRATAATALRRRLDRLRAEQRALAAAPALPEFQMLEVAYWRRILRAEMTWLRALADRLESGAIPWPRHRAVEGAVTPCRSR